MNHKADACDEEVSTFADCAIEVGAVEKAGNRAARGGRARVPGVQGMEAAQQDSRQPNLCRLCRRAACVA